MLGLLSPTCLCSTEALRLQQSGLVGLLDTTEDEEAKPEQKKSSKKAQEADAEPEGGQEDEPDELELLMREAEKKQQKLQKKLEPFRQVSLARPQLPMLSRALTCT